MAAPLKDRIDRDVVDDLAQRVQVVYSAFDADTFVDEVVALLGPLELKARVDAIADALARHLPRDYPDALAVIVAVAESQPDEWAGWPLCTFVERHGLDAPEMSLDAMPVLTQVWSCEFAIRPYLEAHLALTRRFLRRWVHDERAAVRRLVSEGTRPILPWGTRVRALLADPMIGLELLEVLRHDSSGDVRRSVANHLNDLTRNEPALVIDTLSRWVDDRVDPGLIRHALRTLVKHGDPRALALLGFTTEPALRVDAFQCSPVRIALGDAVTLDAELTSTAPVGQRLVVDFVIHHVSARGDTTPKVFKWTTCELAAGGSLRLTKRRRIATSSTRRYRAGFHRVDLQVAGEAVASSGFELVDGSPGQDRNR